MESFKRNFDNQVFLDQIPDPKVPSVVILSRPFELSHVRVVDSRTIYTTALLRSVMVCDEELRKTIKIINGTGLSNDIELPNKKNLCVKAFKTKSCTLNVFILFEYSNTYTLYTGRFTANSNVIYHEHLRNLMQQKQIDEFYFDGSAADVTGFNFQRKAKDYIQLLIDSNADAKFYMVIDDFGYEDLILYLAQSGMKIFLDEKRNVIFRRQSLLEHFATDSSEAQICLTDKAIEQGHKSGPKCINLEFANTDTTKISEYLHRIQYPIYPTMKDIMFIVNLCSPLRVCSIGNTPALPFDWKDLGRPQPTI